MRRTYVAAAVFDFCPSTSPARQYMFLLMGPRLVEYLESQCMPFVRYGGWSDYHDDLPGGLAEGRSLGVQIFNFKKLGREWYPNLRRGEFGVPAKRSEAKHLKIGRAHV